MYVNTKEEYAKQTGLKGNKRSLGRLLKLIKMEIFSGECEELSDNPRVRH